MSTEALDPPWRTEMERIRYSTYRNHTRHRYQLILRSLIISFLLISVLSLTEGENVEAQSDDLIVKVGYINNRPISFNSNNELNGIMIDLLKVIAIEEDWKLIFEEGSRDQCLSRLYQDDIDIIAGFGDTYPCNESLMFSDESIISNWGIIYASSDNEIGSILDLEDRWIGVVKDDIHYNGTSGLKALMNSFKVNANFVEFDNYEELIKALEERQLDAGLLNHLLGLSVEDERDISRTGIFLNPIEVKFAFPANGSRSNLFSSAIDAHLRNMKNDQGSVYYNILDEYLEGDNRPDVKIILPRWLIHIFLIIMGISIFLFGTTIFLRYRVRTRTRELERANRELDNDVKIRKKVEERLEVERNRSFFYLDLLIHDMGNINQGLLNSTQIFKIVRKDRKKVDNTIDTLSQLVERSVSLVRNVQKFSKASTAPFKPEPVDLVPMIRKSLSSVILSFPAKEISYDIKTPNENIITLAEPLLEEVFYNIFHNAVKHHEHGPPKIDIHIRPDIIKNRVMIDILDKGRGIPDHMKGIIFDRSNRAKEAKHIGMGLSLVKVLLDRYGGTIEVKDRKEGDHRSGSMFIITLPMVKPDTMGSEMYLGSTDPSSAEKGIIQS